MVLNETVAEGTAGRLRILTDGSLELTTIAGYRTCKPVALPPYDEVYIDGYVATQRHFIDGLLSGRPHETSGLESLKTMDVVWGAYESAEAGRTVRLQSP